MDKKVISLEERKEREKEFENQLNEVDSQIQEEMSILQQQEAYVRKQTQESLQSYITEISNSSIIDTIITILIEAGLTTTEKFKEKTSLSILKDIEALTTNMESIKESVEADRTALEDIEGEEEKKKAEAMLSMKELSVKVYDEEVDILIEKMRKAHKEAFGE